MQFKQPYPEDPKTPLLAYGVQCYGCLERHPRTRTIFSGIVQFKHPYPRYPKTPLLAFGVQWYGCLERHPRTQTISSAIAQVKHPHPEYLKTPLLGGLWGTVVRVFGALPRNPNKTFRHCGVLSIQKHLCWPMGYNGMGAWSATQERKQYLLALCSSNTVS